MQGGLGVLPQKSFWIRGPQVVHQMLFWVNLPKYPHPNFLKIFLLRFTLIPKMVLGVGKKSEIRLKSESLKLFKYLPSHEAVTGMTSQLLCLTILKGIVSDHWS